MRDHDPPGDPPTAIRRSASGAIDTEYYQRRARADRAGFLRAVLSCLARCGWRAWACIRERMEGQVSRTELSALSARELKDLGLSRGDFDALESGAYFCDSSRDARGRGRLRKRA